MKEAEKQKAKPGPLPPGVETGTGKEDVARGMRNANEQQRGARVGFHITFVVTDPLPDAVYGEPSDQADPS
jgi:hypothetical protein